MGKKKFRFVVASRGGPQSQPWGVTVTNNDIFAYSRSASGLWQFSFHENGRRHLKIGSQQDPRGYEYVEIQTHPHNASLSLGKVELSPLMTWYFPTNSLSKPEKTSRPKEFTFVEAAPEGKITQLLLFRNCAPGIDVADGSVLADRKLRTIYKAGLANDETCHLMAMESEGEFRGFRIPASHGLKGWISPPADVPRHEYTGRMSLLLPRRDTETYQVLECCGSYFGESEYLKQSEKFCLDSAYKRNLVTTSSDNSGPRA